MKNKIAVVTGASSGIGKAVAERLAKEGCDLAIIAQDMEKLKVTQSQLQKTNKKIVVKIYPCDVSNSSQIKKTFDLIKTDLGSVDYLVNDAGFSTSAPIDVLTEEGFDREIAVNIKGTYLCIMNVYQLMKTGGSIVNISSIRGRMGTPTSSPGYAAAKAGVVNLTKSFASQLAKYNIRVNCVAPGAVYPTGMSVKWSEEKRKAIEQSNPLKRIAKPEEVANAIYFLLSNEASFVTGHTLDVNGGDYMN